MPALPRDLIDPALAELVHEHYRNPRHAILDGFMLLEAAIRRRIVEAGAEPGHVTGKDLVHKAFGSKNGILTWRGMQPTDAEHEARQMMLAGAFGALRNGRAHGTGESHDEMSDCLDFAFLSRLLQWVEDAVVRPAPDAEGTPSRDTATST